MFVFSDCPNTGETMKNGICACANTGETVQNGACACPVDQILQNGACLCKTPLFLRVTFLSLKMQ